MKNLILCRHAKSSWKYDVDDVFRPLNARGMLQAPLMTDGCTLEPDQVLCSPAVRAWSTAVCYFKLLHWDYATLQIEPRIHEASCATLMTILKGIEERINTLYIFGHNPSLNSLIDLLDCTNQHHPNLVTSGRVRLKLEIEAWQELRQSCGTIEEWTIPADLT